MCYNFMPVFDWTRSQLDFPLVDGSTALIYDEEAIAKKVNSLYRGGIQAIRKKI